MKKIFIVVFVGIFIMSQLCKSYGSIEAEIEKTHGDLVGSNGASGYAIPAMNLPSGIYQVTMIQNGNVTGIKKFVK